MAKPNQFDIQNMSASETDDVILKLGSDKIKGLSSSSLSEIAKKNGLNVLTTHQNTQWWKELLMHFKSPLIIILLIASAISYAVAETLNASIIILMVLIGVGIDFFQERDARNAAEKLKQIVKTKVNVIRDSTEVEVLSQDIFPGDILLLNAGKIIPADARILLCKEFYVNQSSLTGESFPCQKEAGSIPNKGSDITAMNNIVFAGSNVISGTATVLVINTGVNTKFGEIAEKLISREEETDFGRGMKEFGYLVMKITIVLVLFIFFINAMMKQNMLESFMFAIAVAVGLTPELLPMIMSLTMSKGSLQMAKKGVIVKRLSAIPNFGSMEVLCTDKTGTITEDRIKLIKCVNAKGEESEEVFMMGYLNSFHQTGIKNPLDDAILDHGKPIINTYKKVDEIPFDFYRKRMSVVIHDGTSFTLICKGAPEELLKICDDEKSLLDAANLQYEKLSMDGFRVLGIAVKKMSEQHAYTHEDEQHLSLLGFVAFMDPPKEDADDVIRELASIGVEVKIITGDNRWVTEKICKDIGLHIKGIMQGHEMDMLTDDALSKRVMDTTIFTRFSPDQKNRIITALKGHHHAVGYMGDGINDAPSLKAADIGISVNSGTDVAKETADIILTKKDLLVLKDGILEGRKTFGNTMKYILMGLSSNFGNMFSVAAATLFLPFLPMLPVQILMNNFLYDMSQIGIPSDHVDEVYTQTPKRWNMKSIYRFMFLFGLISSIFDMLTFWILFKYFDITVNQFRTGWFMESLATQILVIFVIRTSMVPFYKSKPSKKLVFTTIFFLLMGWSLPYLPFADKIGFEPLSLRIIVYLGVLVIVYLISAELIKKMFNRKWDMGI